VKYPTDRRATISTFSVPKSVSLYLAVNEDEVVEQMIAEALDKCLRVKLLLHASNFLSSLTQTAFFLTSGLPTPLINHEYAREPRKSRK
jgi:hypothetical protein